MAPIDPSNFDIRAARDAFRTPGPGVPDTSPSFRHRVQLALDRVRDRIRHNESVSTDDPIARDLARRLEDLEAKARQIDGPNHASKAADVLRFRRRLNDLETEARGLGDA